MTEIKLKKHYDFQYSSLFKKKHSGTNLDGQKTTDIHLTFISDGQKSFRQRREAPVLVSGFVRLKLNWENGEFFKYAGTVCPVMYMLYSF